MGPRKFAASSQVRFRTSSTQRCAFFAFHVPPLQMRSEVNDAQPLESWNFLVHASTSANCTAPASGAHSKTLAHVLRATSSQ